MNYIIVNGFIIHSLFLLIIIGHLLRMQIIQTMRGMVTLTMGIWTTITRLIIILYYVPMNREFLNFKKMQMNKIIQRFLIVLWIWIVIWFSYVWAASGVLWISSTDDTNRFTWPTTIDLVSAYTDSYTGLKWEKSPAWWSKTWANANDYCSTLWSWWWRLPTKKELFSIMTDTKPSWMSYYTALPSVSTTGYWSSTGHPYTTYYAWYGNFYYGYVDYSHKLNNKSVLCTHD